jgi:hypothetical protein
MCQSNIINFLQFCLMNLLLKNKKKGVMKFSITPFEILNLYLIVDLDYAIVLVCLSILPDFLCG